MKLLSILFALVSSGLAIYSLVLSFRVKKLLKKIPSPDLRGVAVFDHTLDLLASREVLKQRGNWNQDVRGRFLDTLSDTDQELMRVFEERVKAIQEGAS